MFDLSGLAVLGKGKSRSISWENRTGEKGAGGRACGELGPSRKGSPCIPVVAAAETVTLAEIEGPGVISHIWMTVTDRVSDKNRYVLRDLVLRMYWDDEEAPSVECPLGDFFCCGFGVSYPVNSMPIAVNPTRGFNCYFPMPFGRRARITLENQCDEDVCAFFYQIDYCLRDVLPADTGYFHASWRRQRITTMGVDYVILDQVKGRGKYVGTYLALTTLERYWYGEGEMKFYLDGDDAYPTICGTGTEDYFGGAWSFAEQENGRTVEQNYCTPFLGYPYYSNRDWIHNDYHNDDQMPQRSFYRWHIMDPILFEEDIRVTLQQIGVCHGGLFERQDDVASTAYWYQSEPHTAFAALMERRLRWPR